MRTLSYEGGRSVLQRKSRYNLVPAMSGAIVEGGLGVVFRSKLDLGRRIAGAALAIIGVAIALQLVRAIEANRASTNADWGAYLPVVLLFGTVALAFLLPGALILLYRRDVRVDLENRQVVERQTYLGLGRTRSYTLSSFKKIVLARRLIGRTERYHNGKANDCAPDYCAVEKLHDLPFRQADTARQLDGATCVDTGIGSGHVVRVHCDRCLDWERAVGCRDIQQERH